jgi:hypothetical protein
MALVIVMRQQVDSVVQRCTVYTHFSLKKPVAA